MTVLLGKRKRRAALIEVPERTSEPRANDQRLQRLLQHHFEAKYAPLDFTPLKNIEAEADPLHELKKEKNDDDWEGISDDDEDDDNAPETVEIDQYTPSNGQDVWRKKYERRLFMSSKPPSLARRASKPVRVPTVDTADDEVTEGLNLQNDIALQRLLQESSLLKAARTNVHGTMPSAIHPIDDPTIGSLSLRGTDRHKAVDLRLQTLGAKESLFKQRKMPLNHRLGIVGKRRTKEKHRRNEARENGIVLERAIKEKRNRGQDGAKRVRGVGGPQVGRMRGGTLVLSQSDVRSIESSGGGTSSSRGKDRGAFKKRR